MGLPCRLSFMQVEHDLLKLPCTSIGKVCLVLNLLLGEECGCLCLFGSHGGLLRLRDIPTTANEHHSPQ
ncbi:unnamed protein product [Urochloa humidicola]